MASSERVRFEQIEREIAESARRGTPPMDAASEIVGDMDGREQREMVLETIDAEWGDYYNPNAEAFLVTAVEVLANRFARSQPVPEREVPGLHY